MDRVSYERLYLDFINQNNDFSVNDKLVLTHKISQALSDDFSCKDLYLINRLIRDCLDEKKYGSKAKSKTVKVYDETYIMSVLFYQKKIGLSNSNISLEYKISRTTLAKWKKLYNKYIR